MNRQERLDRLNHMISEGNLIRHVWTGITEDGKERACLLAALSPEAGEEKSAYACPAEVMPAWLAHLTISFDDHGTEEAWPGMILRYAAVAARWHILDQTAWTCLEYASKAVAVREAMSHTTDEKVLSICEQVVTLLDRASSGGEVSKEEWSAARSAAYSAAELAAYSAAWSAAYSAEAWDRMTSAILGLIEEACAKAENNQ